MARNLPIISRLFTGLNDKNGELIERLAFEPKT